MKKGKLIVIEGACDGIGKSTQFALLKENLEKKGEEVVTHHFPSYHTPQGKPVEMYLKGDFGTPKDLSPYFINCLYALDRAVTWNSFLKKEFDLGKTILLDRYTTSTVIYQACVIEDLEERKKFIDYVCDYEYNKLGIKEPDKVIFLHAPFELVKKLREERKENDGISNDVHERDLEFMKKVYENAMFIADYLNWEKIDCTNGEEFDSIESIQEKILRKIK